MTTVRPDGQPQPVPVRFHWDGEGFLLYAHPGARELRNVGANSRVNLDLNFSKTGGDVMRAEGGAEGLTGASPAAEVGPFLEKYREGIGGIGFDPAGFARAHPVAIRAIPTRWQVW